jgi:SEC-C motif-containing protein
LSPAITNCFCGNKFIFEQCCQPIIDGQLPALSAEVLMRSRFTAYVIKDYQYILNTYALTQRSNLSVKKITDNAQHTQWLSLEVLAHNPYNKTAEVEFKVYYLMHNIYYLMHEISNFVFEADKWLYTDGVIQKNTGKITPKKNNQCLCNSGKKFKKCCGK